MRSFGAGLPAIFVFAALVAPAGAQRPSPAPAPTRLQLTVDSIMRGPELVGRPPTQLRWSPDSQKLYFSWRKPGDKADALYVVGREGGTPRRLPGEQAVNAPPANGRWDHARGRLLATEAGDVIIYDGASATRTFVTRTTGAESSARWTRNDTHVTYVRDGNLFIVPVQGGSLSVTQLTDVTLKKADARLTDSQRFIREEEEKLIGYLRQQKGEKHRAEEKAKLRTR